jgi:hypothetical protein
MEDRQTSLSFVPGTPMNDPVNQRRVPHRLGVLNIQNPDAALYDRSLIW